MNIITKNGAVVELADFLEVIHTLAKTHGSSIEEVEEIRKVKVEERGGFQEKVFLNRSLG